MKFRLQYNHPIIRPRPSPPTIQFQSGRVVFALAGYRLGYSVGDEMETSYVYPLKSESFRLGFDWDPYEDVALFLSSEQFEEVTSWYTCSIAGAENVAHEKGKFECYFIDADSKNEISVLIASGNVPEAAGSLLSYLGSRSFEEEVSRRKPQTIGAVFRHKSREQRKKEESDREVAGELKQERQREFETKVRAAAATALTNKDFAGFVAVLKPFEDLLDDGLRKRYSLAKGRIEPKQQRLDS